MSPRYERCHERITQTVLPGEMAQVMQDYRAREAV